MNVWELLLWAAVGTCALGAVMAVVNLGFHRRARGGAGAAAGEGAGAGATEEAGAGAEAHGAAGAILLSVCVPARNEEANIEACVRGLLAQRNVELEVLVYDDDSADATGAIVLRLAVEDPRVRLVAAHPLPAGWVGKQHACQRLGEAARGRWLLFTDADVRFDPGAAAAAIAEAQRLRADLLSTFPRQLTGTLVERIVVPLIHFILFSYLPFPLMRWSRSPAASAGCGQFLLVRREAWVRAGGHAAFRGSMHDGIRLPRRIRECGGRSDLFDGTEVVSCRMYRGAAACWRGFAKNAYEGLGSFPALGVFTAMHLVGHVLPWVWLAVAAVTGAWATRETALAVAAILLALGERGLLAWRFRQSWLGVALHPVGILLMTAIQWHSLLLAKTGRRSWRGRGETQDRRPAPPPSEGGAAVAGRR